jgi:cell cycle arrest protein BUB2
VLDPELFDHLRSKNLQAELHSFQSVMTLCAGTPPLDEVIQIWDFLLAYGVHLNILCVIAQLLKMKEKLMASASCVPPSSDLLRAMLTPVRPICRPMKLLGPNFPPLESRRIVAMTVLLVRDLPESLYAELVRHPRES